MKSLDLLLVNPHQPPHESILRYSAGITPPLGIAYIAAYVKKNGFEVGILDNNMLNLDRDKFEKLIMGNNPLVVGFTMYVTSVNCVFDLASSVRRINREIKIVVGGALATNMYKDILRSGLVDIIVKGEGEQTLAEIVRVLKDNTGFSQVKGIAYMENGQLRETEERGLIENIDEIPFPAYELLPMNKYYLSAPRSFGKNKNIAACITSRGCPYSCSFCSNIFGKKIRFRSAENIIQEIKYLKEKYGIDEFLFWDDNFLLDEGRAIEICQAIINNRLNIFWSCISRVDRASDKLYEILYQAGCREIFFGAESGSQRILNSIKKNVTVEAIKKAVDLCKKYRLLSFCSFMLGLPDDDIQTINETINFAKRLDPDYALFTLFVPMPGSEIFRELQSQNVINMDFYKIKWENYSIHFSSHLLPFQVGSLSKNELIKLQKRALREFYFRPRKILKFLLKIRSLHQIRQLLRGVVSVIVFQFCKVK